MRLRGRFHRRRAENALNSYTVPVKASVQPVQPSRKEFLALAKEHTLVPVCRTLTADLETPVSAFLRAAWPERECFMLESWRTASRWAATPSSA